ncbi:ERCC4 domain-containing protein [Mycena kentingensis (nom. inval.)]|nr:ERCC4 domain-containing protein [Mycena kentingensis (nom. inval.)]
MPLPKNKVIDISDSEDDAPPPTSSQPASSDYDVVDITDSDDEDDLPSTLELYAAASQSRAKTKGKRKRDDDYESSESEVTLESPPKVQRKASNKGRSRKTAEEKAADAAEKQAEKENKKRLKEAEKAQKAKQAAAAKANKKTYMAVNKLVTDKKATLVDMHMCFPTIFAGAAHRPLYDAFTQHVADYRMNVSISSTRLVPGLDVFTWKRTKKADYDETGRHWIPRDPPYIAEESEPTVAVYLEASALAGMIRGNVPAAESARNVVENLRVAVDNPRVQIFFIVSGMTAFVRHKVSQAKQVKEEMERGVASIQMAHGIHFLYVDSQQDAVERLYDLSADLGIKPYKHIERSHLHFCSDTHQATGKDPKDTWLKMLEQVHRLTESGTEGIAADFATPRILMEAYADAKSQREIDGMVANCKVTRRVDGAPRKNGTVGHALSTVIGTVFWERNPLAYATKASD